MPGKRIAGAQRQGVILLYRIFQRLFKPLQPLARLFVEHGSEKGLLVGKRAAGECGSEPGLRLPQRFLLLALLLAQRPPLALQCQTVVVHLTPARQRRRIGYLVRWRKGLRLCLRKRIQQRRQLLKLLLKRNKLVLFFLPQAALCFPLRQPLRRPIGLRNAEREGREFRLQLRAPLFLLLLELPELLLARLLLGLPGQSLLVLIQLLFALLLGCQPAGNIILRLQFAMESADGCLPLRGERLLLLEE